MGGCQGRGGEGRAVKPTSQHQGPATFIQLTHGFGETLQLGGKLVARKTAKQQLMSLHVNKQEDNNVTM